MVKDKVDEKKTKSVSSIDLETLIMSGSTELQRVEIEWKEGVNVELYLRALSGLDLVKMKELTYQEILKYASLNCVYKQNEIKPENRLTEYDLSQLTSGIVQQIYAKIDEISNVASTVDQSDLKND